MDRDHEGSVLDRPLALDRRVALRPEPFGALAYHYGSRRLIFLRHPDVVRVVRAVEDHPTLRATLEACEIEPARWPSFEVALGSLLRSELVHVRHHAG